VGYVQQNPDDQIVGTVVEEDVAFGPENLGVPADELRIRVDAALATAGLTGLERREPHLLSEGQKQRLSIAAALALRPAYLVLDEPTSMLDTQGRAMVLGVLDRLRGDGHGILHVTHHLVDAARADRVVALQAGALAYDGSPEGLLKDSEQMRSLNLERPPIATLADRARSLGAGIPAHAMDADSVVDALWA
jgi:energy-coupling factor transporter ATP-binding protein EcfA2